MSCGVSGKVLRVPHPTRRLRRARPGEMEVQQLPEQPNIETPDGLRDRAILELFYSTWV